jgi:hypothetical protein
VLVDVSYLVAEGPLGRWLLRRPDSGCGRNRSSSETSPSAEDYNEIIVVSITANIQSLDYVVLFGSYGWVLQGTFPIEDFNNPSKIHRVTEIETMNSEIGHAGENLQGRAEFLQKKVGNVRK